MITRSAALALSLLFIVACTPKGDDTDKPKDADGKPEPGAIIQTLENQGFACISGAADQAHTIEVDFGTCMSSSCDRLQSASCTIEQSGAELIVQGTAEISHARNEACTDDCRHAKATCSTGPLAAGSYTLVYAGQRTDVVVPLNEPACTQQR